MRFIKSVKETIKFNVENQSCLKISGKCLKLSVTLPKEIKKYIELHVICTRIDPNGFGHIYWRNP